MGGVNSSNNEHVEKEGTATIDHGADVIEPRECVSMIRCARAD